MSNTYKFVWTDELALEFLNFRIKYAAGFPHETVLKHFKQSKEQVEEKRIEVKKFCLQSSSDKESWYEFLIKGYITEDKYEAVKQAIENVLTDIPQYYCGIRPEQLTIETIKRDYKPPVVVVNGERYIEEQKDAIPPTPEPQDSKEDKGWEITEVECYGGELRRLVNGEYRIFDDGIGWTWKELSERKDTKIKSVRRTSDGEVFTVGDKISWGCTGVYETTLTGFVIKDGDLKFYDERLPENRNPCSFLGAVNLYKLTTTTQPKEEPKSVHKILLYKTEDNWFVYDMDTYPTYKVCSDFSLMQFAACDANPVGSDAKYFHNKEKAEEYILMNKLCLSVSDVIGEIKKLCDGDFTEDSSRWTWVLSGKLSPEVLIARLKEKQLANNKINNK